MRRTRHTWTETTATVTRSTREHQVRAFPRFEVRLAAEITLPSRRVITAVTRDLSLGGAAIESAHPIHEDIEVGVALFVVEDGVEDATEVPLRLGATVMWAQENEGA